MVVRNHDVAVGNGDMTVGNGDIKNLYWLILKRLYQKKMACYIRLLMLSSRLYTCAIHQNYT